MTRFDWNGRPGAIEVGCLPMRVTYFISVLAVVTVLCIGATFLFPVGSGPFSVTHGPATALRAKRAALLLAFSILVAALLTCSSIGIRRLSATFIVAAWNAAPLNPRACVLVQPLLC